MVSDLVIFDTSIFIDDLRTGCHQQTIQAITGLIRTSAVVLAELGARRHQSGRARLAASAGQESSHSVPPEKNCLESGQILEKIHRDHGFPPGKLRDLHCDVLIALAARAHGARLIISNRDDFEMINRYRKLQLEVW
jgi:predicted nucleic acid-binding protein